MVPKYVVFYKIAYIRVAFFTVIRVSLTAKGFRKGFRANSYTAGKTLLSSSS